MKEISVNGRCRCGRVRFVLREEPISFYLCHCTDCQADSGSAFGQSMHVRTEAIDAVVGPVREHTIEGPEGQRSLVSLCANCLTTLWAGREDLPQVRGLNSGSLDPDAGFEPYGNMWTRSARSWAALAPGPRFEQNPPDPLDMVRAWHERPSRES